MSIVVFVNPRSRANRRDPGLAGRFASRLGDTGEVRTPATLEDLAIDAAALAAAPPRIIAVHGGDGTLHKVVGALIDAFRLKGISLPPLAVLTGGTMNVVASSLHIRSSPERMLTELAEDARAGRDPSITLRHCLKVTTTNGDAFGFVFGNGLMANFLEEYYAKDGYGAGRAMWILLRTFLSSLVWGKYARRIFRRFRGKVYVEGHALPWTKLTGVSAATVREVGLGFKMNHRADEDPEKFSVLAIHAGPVKLAADLVPVQLGKGIAPGHAWSAVARRLILEPDAGETSYTIDGDLYRVGGKIEVALGPTLHLVQPRSGRRPTPLPTNHR